MATSGEKEIDDTRIAINENSKELQAPKSNRSGISVVPKWLLDENTRVFYHPQVISLGPYHFVEEGLDCEVMHLKSLIMEEIQEKSHLSLLSKFEDDAIHEKIKLSYSEYSSSRKGFPFSKTEAASMMVRDASFVIEVLESFSKEQNGRNRSDNGGTRASSSIVDTSILDRKRCHPLLNHIVKDMFKMENQLPFWVLQQIKGYRANKEIEEVEISNADKSWYESALENLSPIAVATVSTEGEVNREYKEDHILQLLHDYIVDHRKNGKNQSVVFAVCWGMLFMCFMCLPRCCESIFIRLILFPFFIIWLSRGDYQSLGWPQSVSTVEELKRDGVKFKKLEAKGISHVKFQKSNCTLHLPKFRVDDKSEVILRNLIALEICSKEEEKPVMAYVNLMNHLINTRTDVAILRREDILDNKLGSDEDVAKLWNSFIFTTENPTYKPIDDTFKGISDYRKSKLKVLWAQFLRAHCSKPWLVASALGAVLLLLLTSVQVACLFLSCQRQIRA